MPACTPQRHMSTCGHAACAACVVDDTSARVPGRPRSGGHVPVRKSQRPRRSAVFDPVRRHTIPRERTAQPRYRTVHSKGQNCSTHTHGPRKGGALGSILLYMKDAGSRWMPNAHGRERSKKGQEDRGHHRNKQQKYINVQIACRPRVWLGLAGFGARTAV